MARPAAMMSPQVEGQISQSFDRAWASEYFNMTPLSKTPGQVDGLEFSRRKSFASGSRKSPYLGDLRIPGLATPAEIALSALQYLPYPLMVLNSLKTLVLANDAMGKLLGMDRDGADSDSDSDGKGLDTLKGQTLSQLGIDLLQDMKPVWVNWDSFLESLTNDNRVPLNGPLTPDSEASTGDATPTVDQKDAPNVKSGPNKTSTVHDAVFEVVITAGDMSRSSFADRKFNLVAPKHIFAKM